MDEVKTVKNRESTGKVGYGNPPAETRFKPGESGNTNGRPPGSKNRSTVLKKWIETPAKLKHPETDEEQEGTIEDKIAVGLIKEAIKGDVPAAREILDSVYGKAQQNIHTTGEMQIIVNYVHQSGNEPLPE